LQFGMKLNAGAVHSMRLNFCDASASAQKAQTRSPRADALALNAHAVRSLFST
jgi:hypothetical protein